MSQLNELIADFKKFRKTSATKHYPKELKERTVNLLNEGVPRQELIDKLKLHPTTLSSWKRGPRKKVLSFSYWVHHLQQKANSCPPRWQWFHQIEF